MAACPRSAERDPVGAAHGSAVAGYSQPLSRAGDLPSSIPGMGTRRRAGEDPDRAGCRPARSRQTRSDRVLRRRHLRGGETRGLCVGPTKRGKGSKLMAVVDRHGLPLAVDVARASPAEVTLVTSTLDARFVPDL